MSKHLEWPKKIVLTIQLGHDDQAAIRASPMLVTANPSTDFEKVPNRGEQRTYVLVPEGEEKP